MGRLIPLAMEGHLQMGAPWGFDARRVYPEKNQRPPDAEAGLALSWTSFV
jgi:hypothetical protein